MYYPTLRIQLTGIDTEHVDCGVRATQEAIDWLSKGSVSVSVKQIRAIMGDQDATNYTQWDEVIDRLGGKTLGFSGERTNDWQRTKDHIRADGAAIIAVDYGKYRRSMPNKSGSLTFDDYHAILFVNDRKANGGTETRSFDSLLDGRYRGCPNGPVWVPFYKVRAAAELVGKQETGKDSVYAVLLHRDPSVAGTEPGDLLPEAGTTLSDVLSDMRDVATMMESGPAKASLGSTIETFEDLIGVTGNPEADSTTPVEAGVKV